MLIYILIDYGPKPTGPIRNCIAAKQQIRNFRHVINSSEIDISLRIYSDYSRTRSKLSDLPKLEAILKQAKDRGGKVWIDDFRRIFVKCNLGQRVGLFNELRSYAGHFRDLRTNEDIGTLSQVKARNILAVESPLRFSMTKVSRSTMSAEDKRDQTRKATQASQAARAEAAIQKAEELQRLKAELLKQQDGITNADLAREANKRGLETTRRGRWSATTVKRALKRLDQSTGPDRDTEKLY